MIETIVVGMEFLRDVPEAGIRVRPIVSWGGKVGPACDAPDRQITEAFRRLTSRSPTTEEHRILRALYDEQLEYFETDPDRAGKLLATGKLPLAELAGTEEATTRLAATSILVSALISYDECVTKR